MTLTIAGVPTPGQKPDSEIGTDLLENNATEVDPFTQSPSMVVAPAGESLTVQIPPDRVSVNPFCGIVRPTVLTEVGTHDHVPEPVMAVPVGQLETDGAEPEADEPVLDTVAVNSDSPQTVAELPPGVTEILVETAVNVVLVGEKDAPDAALAPPKASTTARSGMVIRRRFIEMPFDQDGRTSHGPVWFGALRRGRATL